MGFRTAETQTLESTTARTSGRTSCAARLPSLLARHGDVGLDLLRPHASRDAALDSGYQGIEPLAPIRAFVEATGKKLVHRVADGCMVLPSAHPRAGMMTLLINRPTPP